MDPMGLIIYSKIDGIVLRLDTGTPVINNQSVWRKVPKKGAFLRQPWLIQGP